MSRGQALWVHVANTAVSGTGLIYAWMRYLAEPADEWAVVSHPWQPHLQHLHVLAAPLLIFAMGLIWSAHVVGKIKNGSANRTAGIGLAAIFFPMAASGYLVQVSVDPGLRRGWVWVHVVSSLLWVAVFLVHQLRALAAKERAGGNDPSGPPAAAPYQRMVPLGRDASSQPDTADLETSTADGDA